MCIKGGKMGCGARGELSWERESCSPAGAASRLRNQGREVGYTASKRLYAGVTCAAAAVVICK